MFHIHFFPTFFFIPSVTSLLCSVNVHSSFSLFPLCLSPSFSSFLFFLSVSFWNSTNHLPWRCFSRRDFSTKFPKVSFFFLFHSHCCHLMWFVTTNSDSKWSSYSGLSRETCIYKTRTIKFVRREFLFSVMVKIVDAVRNISSLCLVT